MHPSCTYSTSFWRRPYLCLTRHPEVRNIISQTLTRGHNRPAQTAQATLPQLSWNFTVGMGHANIAAYLSAITAGHDVAVASSSACILLEYARPWSRVTDDRK
eukprot:TRINITY_DN11581_c0_g1_i2.p1 TRINITY_DN11581_c0_g1~~TRINITY_DN11581_c0_g1_i2.p1  ORF type:complete len:103 (-),score=2.45 TRINITY_DN11581_c0_g1_i2:197-505(-)